MFTAILENVKIRPNSEKNPGLVRSVKNPHGRSSFMMTASSSDI